ncbi:MAG: hypothetical protein R3192_06425 [Woeseiaceae bacterium]|nr:hypothetical protein [Woeseiaceae bacterium]
MTKLISSFGICRNILLPILAAAVGLTGCGSSSNAPPASPPIPPPAPPLMVSGIVTDGPVFGGTIFVFTVADVLAALENVESAEDRLEALNAANSIGSVTRDPLDEDQYEFMVPPEHANTPVFFVFDNTDAEDDTFKDTPPNLAAVVMLGDAGSVQRVNVSLQTTLIALQVLAALDPDGDGIIVDNAAIATAIDDATANVLSAFAKDALGRDLNPVDFDPVSHEDDDEVHGASSVLGFLLRVIAAIESASFDDILSAIAADIADGLLDGVIPVNLAPTPEMEALAAAISDIASFGSDDDIDVFAVGPCSSAAVAMKRACSVDTADDLFEGRAICTDIADDADRVDCLADVDLDVAEKGDECDEVFDARLALCETLGDAAHEPAFGEDFAANFVDPLDIGGAVAVNPWFPLVTGNHWLYLGDGESIEVLVTDETKLIDGITCVVVIDTASEDGVVVEITRDWYAQDVDGNVWYCGEIARNFEVFDGDVPQTPELVDIDGSWKAGRDGSEAGILLPFDPQVGDVFRQEVAYGEAEDAVEILSITADEAAPGAACAADCLMTADFTPLEPGVLEHKFYVPGIGLIVEVDTETGDRVELDTFTPGPPP